VSDCRASDLYLLGAEADYRVEYRLVGLRDFAVFFEFVQENFRILTQFCHSRSHPNILPFIIYELDSV